jgi:probable addiction module antidote protein
MPTTNYEDFLLEDLADPAEAAGYLSACLEEGPEVFLLGLRDVAKAQGGMTKLAREADLAREPLYRMLSENGNPTFASVTAIISSLGIRLQCVPSK